MSSVVSTIDSLHEDMIHDVQLDYYSKRLATCSSDRTIKVFDVQDNGTNQQVAEIKGHEGPVWQVAWAHPKYGSILASCSYDRKVIVWKEGPQTNQWSRFYEYDKHESSVNSIAWAPHEFGLTLAAGSSDGRISIHTYKQDEQTWDVAVLNAHTIGVNAVSWAPAVPAGALISGNPTLSPKRFVSGGCDNLVKIWKLEADNTWKNEEKLEHHTAWVRDVAWAPSIGLPTNTIASCSQDGTVVIWSQTGNGSWSKKVLPGASNVVSWRVSWSITGNILAVSSDDNKVTLWKEGLDTDNDWKCIEGLDATDTSQN